MSERTVMLTSKRITFRTDAVLTREMLQELHDFPHHVLDLCHGSYHGGYAILSGLDFQVDAETKDVWLTRGIVRSPESFYLLTEAVNLSALLERVLGKPKGQNIRFALCESTRKVSGGVPCEGLELAILEADAKQNALLELCTFYYHSLLQLPDPSSPEEFTQNAYLNIVNTPYICRDGTTFHPHVFRAVLHLLQNKARKSMLDYALALTLQQHGIVPWATVRMYVEECGEKWPVQDSCEAVFNVFCKCLRRPAPEMVVRPEPKVEIKEKPKRPESLLIYNI